MVLACLLAAGVALPAAAAQQPSPLSGLWQGQIVYEPAELELDAVLELAPDAQGRLVGTVDIPSQGIRYLPISSAEVDGDRFHVVFRWPSELRGADAPYEFVGEVAEGGAEGGEGGAPGGKVLTGTFIEGENRNPFELRRLGPAGTPRPEVAQPPLHDLSTDLAELRQAFNEDEDRVRLVLLLSPT